MPLCVYPISVWVYWSFVYFYASSMISFFFLQKNYQAARKEYEAALKLDPDNKLLQENLRKLERAENTAKRGN